MAKAVAAGGTFAGGAAQLVDDDLGRPVRQFRVGVDLKKYTATAFCGFIESRPGMRIGNLAVQAAGELRVQSALPLLDSRDAS